jgi:asparagine synthase (glutamine-hydrolysing)
MDAVTRLETDYYLRNTLLRDADVFSMAHSLELRMPFVDHRVLGAALGISNRRRAAMRKKLLVDAVDHKRLAELLRLPKRGFRLPMERWLRGPLSDRVDALPSGTLVDLCDEREIRRHVDLWRRGSTPHAKVWALVTLAAWLERR